MASVILSNSSSNVSTLFYQSRVDWILPVSLNAVFLLVNLVILFSMVHYGVKAGKWKRNHVLFVDKLNGGWVYTLAVKFTCMSFIKLIVTQVSYNTGYGLDEDFTCEVVNDMDFIVYGLVVFLDFAFLWIRQRIFYSNKMLNIDFSKFLRFLSLFSLLLIGVAGTMVVIFTILPINFFSSPRGCTFKSNSSAIVLISSIFSAVTITLAEVILVFLLVYPLQNRLENRKLFESIFCCDNSNFSRSGKESAEVNRDSIQNYPSPSISNQRYLHGKPADTSLEPEPHKKVGSKSTDGNPGLTSQCCGRRSCQKIKQVMRKTIIFGSISLFSHILLIFINSLSDLSNPGKRRILSTFYDINVMLNILLVVFSFSTYKRILLSPLRKTK